MRVRSLVILAVIAGTAAYFIFLTPQWSIDLYDKAMGYGPAATPTEAVDKFFKAVKARNLRVAVKFCTGDYAEQLKRGAVATKELGPIIDAINEYMKNKGLASNKSVTLLYLFDPFPPNVTMGNPPKEIDGTKAKGFAKLDQPWSDDARPMIFAPGTVPPDFNQLDPKMYNRVLMPVNLFEERGFDLVKEGGEWKLSFPLAPAQVQYIDHFLNKYKTYHTRLSTFRRDITNERFDSKTRFESELVTAMQDSAK